MAPPAIGDCRSEKKTPRSRSRKRSGAAVAVEAAAGECRDSSDDVEMVASNAPEQAGCEARKRPRRAAAAAAAATCKDEEESDDEADKVDVIESPWVDSEDIAMILTAFPAGGGDGGEGQMDFLPHRRLVDFEIHDAEGQAQPIEILESTQLYFTASVLPLSGPLDKHRGAKCSGGPLSSWWIAGYDSGTPVIWVCTEVAEYICVKCAPGYKRCYGTLWDKSMVVVAVYRALSKPDGGNPHLSLDELAARLSRTLVMGRGSGCFGQNFSRDYLYSIGNFVVSQLETLDASASGDEQVFSGLPVLRALQNEYEKRSENLSLRVPLRSTGALVINECSAGGSETATDEATDDAKLAYLLQEEENRRANCHRRVFTAPRARVYIKMNEDEIASDYPLPEFYKPDEEEIDEYILFDGDYHAAELPRRMLNDWCLYNSDFRYMPLELLPMVAGAETDVEVFGSGLMAEDDGSGYCMEGDSEPSSAEAHGIRMYLSSVKEWMIEFGYSMISISLRTDVAWYRLGKPSTVYAPWYKTILKIATLGRKIITVLKDAARVSRVSFSDMVKVIADQPEDSSFFISRKAAEVEKYLLVHGQVLVQQFAEYPEKWITDSTFVNTLAEMMVTRHHTKLAMSRRRVVVKKGRNLNPRANVRPDSAKMKPMRATTTHLINRIWSEYYSEDIQKNVSATEDGKEAEIREVEDLDEEDDALEEEEENVAPNIIKPQKASEGSKAAAASKPAQHDVKWIGKPIGNTSQGESLYANASLSSREEVRAGTTVLFQSEDGADVFLLVEYLYGNKGAKCMAHGRILEKGTETVLGNAANKRELFLTNECRSVPLDEVRQVPKVELRRRSWGFRHRKQNATLDEEDRNRALERERQSLPLEYFCRALYAPQDGAFFSLPYDSLALGTGDCGACKKDEADGLVFLPDNSGFRLDGVEYHVDDFVYVEPDLHQIGIKDEKFKAGRNKGLRPFDICQLLSIDSPSKKRGAATQVTVRKFYRPEDVDSSKAYRADVSEVFYSEDVKSVAIRGIRGKCKVLKHSGALESDFKHVFFCVCIFDPIKKTVKRLPANIKLGTKGVEVSRDHSSCKGKGKAVEEGETNPQIHKNKLATLDVFAGCGGLSEGLHQAGVACTKWAIEYDHAAATAFKLNHAETEMFCENCNVVLRSIMEKGGDLDDCLSTPEAAEMCSKLSKEQKDKLPSPGEVDFITGGPPCQGFSGMNRFNQRSWSKVQCEMILAFLSYAEYFCPRFFLLENVRNFVSFNKAQTFRLSLACLLEMGYQVRFGVLQAGNYGVSQSRTRAFIWAAAPGETLPAWPEPVHVFASSQLKVPLSEGVHYSAVKLSGLGAPLRSITVRDAIGDLPPVANGAEKHEIAYGNDPESWFQKQARGSEKMLYDHVCKEMNELNYIRCQRIPKQPGADWRDLPEEKVRLTTGQLVDLIPWCLPNTAARHNQWKGLFGRLDWDGNFPTSVTDPQPMGKVGMCFHPEQDRIVTVRECARSQGFPDRYKFFGSIQSKHRQIGNAVPPPLARALGAKLKEVVN